MSADKGAEIQRQTRRVWSYNETVALLNSYSARKQEFEHPRRKRFAYQSIVEDLTSMNIMEKPVSTAECENEIKGLIRAYKSAVDNNNKTGRAASIVPYEAILDEVFGTRACISANISHVIGVGQCVVQPLPLSQSVSTTNSIAATPSSSASSNICSESEKPVKRKKRKTAMDVIKIQHKEREANRNLRFKEKVEFLEERKRRKQARHEEKKLTHEELMKVLTKK